MPSSLKFRPRMVPTVAALACIALAASLGNWQLNRAAEKLRVQQRVEQAGGQAPIHIGQEPLAAPDIVYRRVEASGEFIREDTVFVDNRTREGIPGYEVVTPLKVDGGGPSILVNRGWTPASADRSQLPQVTTGRGKVTVEGIAVPGDAHPFELSRQVQSGALWENVTVGRYEQAFGLRLQPIILRAQSDLGDGLRRDWVPPDVGIERHRAYAFQWFALALAVLIFYVVSTVKRTSGEPATKAAL